MVALVPTTGPTTTLDPDLVGFYQLRFDATDRRAIRRAGGVRLTVRGTAGGRKVRTTTTLRRG